MGEVSAEWDGNPKRRRMKRKGRKHGKGGERRADEMKHRAKTAFQKGWLDWFRVMHIQTKAGEVQVEN
ncbi:uncharacterized protein B0T23DRAFT_386368 [Neurospora hispaniola]|uniref:Uncharacterized protein n=1 Tax=Neurospora hispaniola TaxID=588809 RepID=A0AAJ0I1J6_9PEZI|nr:hypothetical protein B0T23DRAFT_386368 [Neurospora hispaniola]